MINYLQEKLQVRFPNEDLQVLLYTTIKQPVSYFGGEKQFYKQQEYDNLKREWCKYHNHFLLEITYKEDVNESLSNYLSQFNDYPKEEYSISD